MYTLCLDFGNSRQKAALMKSINSIIKVLDIDDTKDIKKILESHQITHSIYSSVVEKKHQIENILSQKTSYTFVNELCHFHFEIHVSKPKTIGADRLALLEQAVKQFPNSNTLIICMGSCITYNFINVFNQFLGGSISPGIMMRLKALHTETYSLPQVEFNTFFSLVADNTKTNILSGVIFGVSKEIEGVVEEYQKRYKKLNVIITGGDSEKIKSIITKDFLFDQNFLFKGLYNIAHG